jgi:membrane-associated phospholipid phosphatase
MSVSNGLNRVESEAAATLRRLIANVRTALGLLTRSSGRPPVRAWPLSPRDLAIAVGISVAAILFLMVFVDAAVTRSVAHLPHWVVSVFDEITEFGKSGWFLWPLGVLFLVLAALPPVLTPFSQRVLATVMVRVGFLFTAIAVPNLLVTIVKRMIGRARPYIGGSLDPLLFDPFKWVPAYAGMPSGHATTAFAVLVAFGTLWPRARTMLLVYALLIVVSRVVLVAHYPSDVLAGALVGIIGAVLVRRYFAQRHLGFTIGPDGRVHQYPGPSLRRMKTVARELLAP